MYEYLNKNQFYLATVISDSNFDPDFLEQTIVKRGQLHNLDTQSLKMEMKINAWAGIYLVLFSGYNQIPLLMHHQTPAINSIIEWRLKNGI